MYMGFMSTGLHCSAPCTMYSTLPVPCTHIVFHCYVCHVQPWGTMDTHHSTSSICAVVPHADAVKNCESLPGFTIHLYHGALRIHIAVHCGCGMAALRHDPYHS